MDLDGAVTLDTDNHGTPLDIEATAPSEPLNVNLGTASTVVSIADQSQTLANLGSPVTLNGGGSELARSLRPEGLNRLDLAIHAAIDHDQPAIVSYRLRPVRHFPQFFLGRHARHRQPRHSR